MNDEKLESRGVNSGGKESQRAISESLIAGYLSESPTGTEALMEEVCEKGNLKEALKRVKANKGSGGIDGMTVEELAGYLKENWLKIKEQLLAGTYKPCPVKLVEILKADGGKRKLGIPTVLDRFIQQAILQVLQGRYDGAFSCHSYGFRPKKSAHQAIFEAKKYIGEGFEYVVDIDLEQFFDRVNHDRLMSKLAKMIKDKRMLKIIRAYLSAGIMKDGLVKPREQGTPQGGNLSPFLSNIVLDELDKELEKRGHKFVRYADDCNIYVKSRRAGERVMESITKFITEKLKLKVNQEKSRVDIPSKRKFLGYSFALESEVRLKISLKSIERFKDRIREITRRTRGVKFDLVIEELGEYFRGWMGYYGYCQKTNILKQLDAWIRRRLRCYIWTQWKTFNNRVRELLKRGVPRNPAYIAAYNYGSWAGSTCQAMSLAFPNRYFTSIGYRSLMSYVKV